jgi:hypothetical protein
MAFWSALSFERIDVSIIFEPTLTTRPPMRLSSTVVLIRVSAAVGSRFPDKSPWI